MTNGAVDLERRLSAAITAADPGIVRRLERDPESLLELARLTAEADARVGEMLNAAVSAARRAGHTWEAIGRSLGVSRQAAQQRFGSVAGADDLSADRRLLSSATAFDEMQALERAGRYGWHSVGYGVLHHVLERSDEQWEHRRVPVWSRRVSHLEEEGWQRIGTMWFPWAYYARPTGQPALTGPMTTEPG
jgi:hypothetical protein